ncbi:MAG: type II toxin-antitoxin system VapC family toxin [archaeon GB-1867-035]|nr:type II toxin-antitoxin system VapC family toxin [Candidatus Culexmicrobium profundum]
MARFLDSSAYLHAYLKPKRKLTKEEMEIKRRSIEILRRIDEGEKVLTTVIHIAEIINIIESKQGLNKALHLLETLLALENMKIIGINREDYEYALSIADKLKISPNDALAALSCRKYGIKEVYSFDKHYDNIPWIKRVID